MGKINQEWGVEENQDHLDGIRREEDHYWKICKTPDRIFFMQQQRVKKNRNSRMNPHIRKRIGQDLVEWGKK